MKRDIGIIGGADGPTSIIVSGRGNEDFSSVMVTGDFETNKDFYTAQIMGYVANAWNSVSEHEAKLSFEDISVYETDDGKSCVVNFLLSVDYAAEERIDFDIALAVTADITDTGLDSDSMLMYERRGSELLLLKHGLRDFTE